MEETVNLFFVLPEGRTKPVDGSLYREIYMLKNMNNLLAMRIIKQWNSHLPHVVVGVPLLVVFKQSVDS